MTLQELTEYSKLCDRIEQNKQILESLRTAAEPGAQVLTGMPHAPGVKDKVGDLAVEIADMEERIRFQQEAAERQKDAVETFIESIEDDRLRIACRLRFIRGLAWSAVADVMGFDSEENVRRMCYRHIGRQ